MMLLTKANKADLPGIRSQDGKGFDAIAHVKFFGGSDMSFYATEYDPDGGDDATGEFFGLWTNRHGSELCYVSMSQLRMMRFPPFRLGIERDRYFKPTTLTVCDEKRP